ncbi:MAG: PhnA domain-containing protein [Sphingobacteriales bacterium]|jgi:protein PhnA|nr:PhnA domain-containing protein [Sphingobacteriales bacterium]NCT73457.1 PhnA protein [Chitinophagaceae bacterium]OJW35040.1 MAG: PhnA protein [Sphingobacteriales bacterium 46-32]
MTLEQQLQARSEHKCELCGESQGLSVYQLPPDPAPYAEQSILVCPACLAQIEKKAELDTTHWQCLTTSMWSEVPAVQVVTWRMLNRMRQESWAADAIDMMYLSDENLAWAKATGDHENDGSVQLHRDSNGHQLLDGDTVVLIKSLDVKGSTLTAKLGTVVRNIRLVADNTEQIEGRVEGQQIVILTKYVRKQHQER